MGLPPHTSSSRRSVRRRCDMEAVADTGDVIAVGVVGPDGGRRAVGPADRMGIIVVRSPSRSGWRVRDYALSQVRLQHQGRTVMQGNRAQVASLGARSGLRVALRR